MITRDPRAAQLSQKTQIVTMLLVVAMVILLVQLWLLTIATEEYLAAHHALAVPTFFASAFCFLLNLGLLKYLYDVDK